MMNEEKAMLLRAKKLGVLLREARKIAGQRAETCAQVLGVPLETYEAYELGDAMPSLPEIEALAYFLNVPLSHFWESTHLSLPQKTRTETIEKVMALRHRLIGAHLRKYRRDSGLSLEELAQKIDITPDLLLRYELGERPIPLPLLERMAAVCNRPIRDFYDQKGPFGQWMSRQNSVQQFLELPLELQEFVAGPINRPFLELAQRLSEMPVQKLRGVAEGLLEITL
ncbi:MAG: hypothetical protein Fur0018_10990 [Anaerolineales bacterium]